MKYRNFFFALIITIGTSSTYAFVVPQQVYTPTDFFYSCEDAKVFLVEKYDNLVAFEKNKIKKGIDKKYLKSIKKLEERIVKFDKKLIQAKKNRNTELTNKLVLESAFFVLQTNIVRGVVKPPKNLTAQERKILKAVANKLDTSKQILAEQSMGQKFSLSDTVADVVIDNVDLIMTAAGVFPGTAAAIAIIKGFKVAAEVAILWIDKTIDVDYYRDSIQVAKDGMKRLYIKSPQDRLKKLQETKEIINFQCFPKQIPFK